MAHVVHHENNSGMGFLIGVILLIVFVLFIWYWGVPAVRQTKEGVDINVPSQIDVNINREPTQQSPSY